MAKISLQKLAALKNDSAENFLRMIIDGADPSLYIAITFIKMGAVKAEDRRRFRFIKVADFLENPKSIIDAITLGVMDKWNLYVMPTLFRSPPEKRGMRGGKDLIAGGSVLWTDIDLPEKDWDKKDYFTEKYKHWEIPPTSIISSGRGFHLFWKLDSFVTDIKEIENRNRWLRTQLDGDDCFSADHIMRIPGTKNFKPFWKLPPDVYLAHYSGKDWKLTDFQIEVDSEEQETGFEIQEENLPDDFLETLPRDLKDRIVNGPAGESDRSANDWYVARKLVEIGYNPGQLYAVFMNMEWEVGAKGRNNNSYIVRTIHKAWKEHKVVSVTRPKAFLQPVIEKHLLHYDKHGKVSLVLPAQSLPVIKEACEMMMKHGYRFLADKGDRIPYLVTDQGTVIRATGNSKEFSALICNMTEFTPDSRAHRMFQTGIIAYASTIAIDGQMHPWSWIDHKTNEWRVLLDHASARDVISFIPNKEKEIKQIVNGSDGVILTSSIRCGGKQIFWNPEENWEAAIGELIDNTHDMFPCSELDKQFLVCFMLAIPIAAGLIHNGTLPLLHLTGGSGQGKTGTLKTISAFIHGTTSLESGTTGAAINIIAERDFFIPFDDYETLPDFLQQFILTNASGAVRHKVKDIEADTVASQRAHLMLALTSIGDLDIITLRRRAIQVNVSSSTFGTPNYDETHKERIINKRSYFWNAYIHFMCERILPYLNANTLNQKAAAVGSMIKTQEFKPLSPFITLIYEIGHALSKFDSRFQDFSHFEVIPRLIDSLGISSNIVFEGSNAIIEPLTQLCLLGSKKKKDEESRGRSSTGIKTYGNIGDGVYLEQPDLYVKSAAVWFEPKDCVVLGGLPSAFAIKLMNIGHKGLFNHGQVKSLGQAFSKYVKESIGCNNLNAMLEYDCPWRGRHSKLYQMAGSNIYVQYLHGIDATGRGSAWRFWYPLVDTILAHEKQVAKVEQVFTTAPKQEHTVNTLINALQELISKNTGTPEDKMKLIRALSLMKETGGAS